MQTDTFEERAEAYALLARVFASEPDADAVEAFARFDWASFLGEDVAFAFEEDYERVAAENRAEFARMFLGPKKLPAPPYESAYRSGARCMWGPQTSEVREAYEAAGIRRDGSLNEPDDFVGFELQFASSLLTAARLAEEAGDGDARAFALERYREFLDGHLGRWIPAFCNDILAAGPAPFMAACARALKLTVETEARL